MRRPTPYELGSTVHWIWFHLFRIIRHSCYYYDIWYVNGSALRLISVIDCYYPVAFDALLLVCGLKNIFAFGFSYGVINWIQLDTFQGAFGAMVGIQCGVMLFAVPLYYYGKQIRHASGTWRVISW